MYINTLDYYNMEDVPTVLICNPVFAYTDKPVYNFKIGGTDLWATYIIKPYVNSTGKVKFDLKHPSSHRCR